MTSAGTGTVVGSVFVTRDWILAYCSSACRRPLLILFRDGNNAIFGLQLSCCPLRLTLKTLVLLEILLDIYKQWQQYVNGHDIKRHAQCTHMSMSGCELCFWHVSSTLTMYNAC